MNFPLRAETFRVPAASTGVCSSSYRCLHLSAGCPRRRTVRNTLAPDRAEAWTAQVQVQVPEGYHTESSERNWELEDLRRRLIKANDTSIRRPADNGPAKASDMAAPSLGWRWLPHQLAPEQLWERIRAEASTAAANEPVLSPFYHDTILRHRTLGSAMASLLADKLSTTTLPTESVVALFNNAYISEPALLEALAADMNAVYDRDPACGQYIQVALNFKGFQALQTHRVAHWLWTHSRKALAHVIQSRMSETFHVDIHPGAQVGWGLMLDHATGIVIGETAVLGDNVSMLHHVTLGGSGTGSGIRHPTVGHGVLLGAGVSVLGPIMIGAGTKVGAGSVVVRDLPCHCVAVGVPARIVKYDIQAEPVQDMDQCKDLFVIDYVI